MIIKLIVTDMILVIFFIVIVLLFLFHSYINSDELLSFTFFPFYIW